MSNFNLSSEDFNKPTYFDFSSWTRQQTFDENRGIVSELVSNNLPNTDNFLGNMAVSQVANNLLIKPIVSNPAFVGLNTGISIAESIQLTNAAVELGFVNEFGIADAIRNVASIAVSSNPQAFVVNQIVEMITDQKIASVYSDFNSFNDIRNIVRANDPAVTGYSYKEMGELANQARREASEIYQASLISAGGYRNEDFLEEGFSSPWVSDPFGERNIVGDWSGSGSLSSKDNLLDSVNLN